MSSKHSISGGVIPPHCEPILRYWQRQMRALIDRDEDAWMRHQLELIIELNQEELTSVEQAQICEALEIPFTREIIDRMREFTRRQQLRDFLRNLPDPDCDSSKR